MSDELEKLARPKSRAIPCIIREGDIIRSQGDSEIKILKYETNNRIALSIVGDFDIQRKPRHKV